MKFSRVAVPLVPLVLLGAVAALSLTTIGTSVAAAAPAVHVLTVTGAGTSTYPGFSPATARYGLRTTSATAGAVTVNASTDAPGGKVFVDGALATGPVRLTGLATGDEISVVFQDAGPTVERHSVIYLPAGFPELTATGTASGTDGTLMTLNPFGGNPDRWMVALDGHAVPRFVRRYTGNRHDLKRLANGHYSVSQDVALPAGNVILELDDDFREIGRRSTVGLENTDFHDSLLLDDGSRVLMAYEPNDVTGNYDSVFQEIDPDGDVAFSWSTADHIDLATERVATGPDYSHMNSVQVMSDGDYLVSLRHLSVVLKIARTAHDGFAEGDIVWRLGGRLSDFDLTGDPLGGPCAQHTASETSPGRIMVFDNGAGFGNKLCVDPADPAGAAVERPSSRVVEYALDETDPAHRVATVVDQYVPGRFVSFAGSAERLANGNTLIGWTNAAEGVATELGPDFEPLWDVTASDGFGSYRVSRGETPDVQEPTAVLTTPADGATYDYGQQVLADFGCTDRGGSGLAACSAEVDEGSPLDTTTPGVHAFVLIARDGDGNEVTTRRSYTVGPAPVLPPTTPPTTPPATPPTTPPATPPTVPAPAPDHGVDLTVRHDARTRLTTASPREKVVVVLRNTGDVPDRFVLAGPRSSRSVGVRYRLAGQDVTRAVTRGTLRTTALDPGGRAVLKLVLTRRAGPDAFRTLRVRAGSVADPNRRDTVGVRVRAR